MLASLPNKANPADAECGTGRKGRAILHHQRKMNQHAPAQVLSISQTNALTITIDPKGRIRMKGFLKKNLP